MSLAVLIGWLNRQARDALVYRMEENRVLRAQLSGRRLRLTDVRPTATCRLLCVLLILAHERRRVVHIAVTDHPTAAPKIGAVRHKPKFYRRLRLSAVKPPRKP